MSLIQSILKNSIILKSVKNHTATVIFCHGLGDTGDGWSDVMEMVQEKDNGHIKFILPNAPVQPVTLNNGYRMNSWYDIKSLSKRGDEDKDDVDKSRNINSGIPSERIMIGGFSQGAALSLYTFYQTKHKLAGMVALSGYLPLSPVFASFMQPTNKSQPLLMCHGMQDVVVRYEWGKMSFDLLKSNGATGDFVTYNYMGHSSSPEEISHVQIKLSKEDPLETLLEGLSSVLSIRKQKLNIETPLKNFGVDSLETFQVKYFIDTNIEQDIFTISSYNIN
ncbi:esterase/lipase/thioesterase domain-containing protein [Heterostelium album PN500]|uniref:palmitoyl-protein hydrolase n=1 Tax=Heterostelium pallidum (strain ATCC 26659 / Pp 5 / PN500) TaxID=670386 RepID=D3B703_HETP5|nr:esterase/lipase/thioesterase domain-containing protein [Heterostelium album PN500]EFA82546.1 esterase/lipase/thioesterase domain-containing protein [Heterostelium album PN500]|eukprot:XP_020434663.1 esterase/lipase/thioesterase domain-containing protein [Heterostelium album PN500]